MLRYVNFYERHPMTTEGDYIDYYGDGRQEKASSQVTRPSRPQKKEPIKSPRQINREKVAKLLVALCEKDTETQKQLLSEKLNLSVELEEGRDLPTGFEVDGKRLFLNANENLNIWRGLERLDQDAAMLTLLPFYKDNARLCDAHGDHNNLATHLVKSSKSRLVKKMFMADENFAKENAVDVFKLLTPSKYDSNKMRTEMGHIDLLVYLLDNYYEHIQEKSSVSHHLLMSDLPDRRVFDSYVQKHPDVLTDPDHRDFIPLEKLFDRWNMNLSTIEHFFKKSEAAHMALNTKDNQGETPLFRLALLGVKRHKDNQKNIDYKDDMVKRTDVADLMVSYGASVNVTDKRDWTILDRLSQYEENNSPMVKLLTAHGAGFHKQISPLFSAQARQMRIKPSQISLPTPLRKNIKNTP